MQRVKILRILSGDFRKNAATLYDELKRKRSLWQGELGKNEAYVFVSHTGRAVMFVLGVTTIATRDGTRYACERRLVDYRVWRIDGGSFDPRCLEDYGNAVGLSFGLESFREQWSNRHN